MHAVPYDDIVRGVLNRVGWPASNLTTDQSILIRDATARALKTCWESYWWSVLMVTERRQLRYSWDADETYLALEEVYHLDSNAYYVALRANLDATPPATFNTTDNVWETNDTHWARQWPDNPDVSEEAPESWDSDEAYAVGDRVVWNNETYQCWSATTAGIQPDNASFWGLVKQFDYVLPLTMLGYRAIGRVRTVQNCNPATSPYDTELEFEEQADGVRLFGITNPKPWITYRIRCPILNGSVFDEGDAYSAETENRAVFGLPLDPGVRLIGTDGGDYLEVEDYIGILVL